MTDYLDGSVWLFAGLAAGFLAGWALASTRIGKQKAQAIDALEKSERQRRADLAADLEASERRSTTLRTEAAELRNRLESSAAKVEELAAEARDQGREMDRAEARIFDRESTIDSLRAKLFAARNTARNLESELEATKNEMNLLKEHFNESHTDQPLEIAEDDALSSIVVDLGDTLSVERD